MGSTKYLHPTNLLSPLTGPVPDSYQGFNEDLVGHLEYVHVQ